MKSVRATLPALLLLALMAFPVMAEEGSGTDKDDSQQGEMVTKTFTLTLKGDVPEDATFPLFYATRDEIAADPEDPNIVLFCGQPPAEFGLEPKADCEAGVYTESVQFEAGTEVAFAFARASETDQEVFEFFHQSFDEDGPSADDPGDFEMLNTDFTNTAWYTFAGDDKQDDDKDDGQDDGQDDDQQDDDQDGDMPDEMPDTGAGGMAPVAPAVPLAAAGVVTLLFAGASTLVRLRR